RPVPTTSNNNTIQSIIRMRLLGKYHNRTILNHQRVGMGLVPIRVPKPNEIQSIIRMFASNFGCFQFGYCTIVNPGQAQGLSLHKTETFIIKVPF
ncbi:MAG: hypothetical protein ACRCX5_14865, partial [Bacteroidales bacterium]